MATRSPASFDACEESSPGILIRYFGSIRTAAGKPEENLAFTKDMTVLHLLGKLANINGGGFRGEIFDAATGLLRDDLMVTVNEAIIEHGSLAGMLPEPGDVVALLPLFPGGG